MWLRVLGIALTIAVGIGVAALAVRFVTTSPPDAPATVLRAVGPVDEAAPLARAFGNVESFALLSGLSVATPTARISLAADGVGGAWTSRRDGALRSTSFGHEAVVFRRGETEELLAVDRRVGARTWRWQLDSGGLTPRLGADGAVTFRGDHRLAPLAIAPVVILDAEGQGRHAGRAALVADAEAGSLVARAPARRREAAAPVRDRPDDHAPRLRSPANNGAAGATSITLNDAVAGSCRATCWSPSSRFAAART